MFKRILTACLVVCSACSGCDEDTPNTPPKQEDMSPPPVITTHPAPTKTVVGAGTLKSKTYKTTVVVGQ